MDIRTLLVVSLALVALQLAAAHPVERSCACGLKGIDACSCVPAAPVRPIKIRPPSGVQRVVLHKYAPPQFKPIGDVCTCNVGGLIQPADVPSVPCKVHQPCDGNPSYSVSSDCDTPSNPCEDTFEAPVTTYTIRAPENTLPAEELIEDTRVPVQQGPVAADAVSLAIAYDLASRKNKRVKEEILNFGPLSKPTDGFIRTKKVFVPESGLHQLRNEIVELRASSGFGSTCEDDADASLLAAQDSSCGDVEETGFNGRLLTYSDLGFAPVNKPCNNFVSGSFTPAAPQVVQTVEYSVPASSEGQSGPSYTACDALGGVERGRGTSGYDGFEGGAVEEVNYGDTSCPRSNPNYVGESSYGTGDVVVEDDSSYEAPAPRPVQRHHAQPHHHPNPHPRPCNCRSRY